MAYVNNDWIPTAAFIEHFVLNHALETGDSLDESSKTVNPHFGVPGTLVLPANQTRLLNLLYCLLVFPTEQWRRKGLLELVIERAKSDGNASARIRGMICKTLVRSLRNSVAHARIQFLEDGVEFTDQRGNAEPHFRLKLSIEDAVQMTLILGRAFHEAAQVNAAISATPGGNS